VQRPDLAARHKADLEVIGVQRLLQMQGIDDAGDLQHFIEAVATLGSVDLRRLPDAEQRYRAREVLGVLCRIGAVRQADIDTIVAGPGPTSDWKLCRSLAVAIGSSRMLTRTRSR
jgi:hypothetical protein